MIARKLTVPNAERIFFLAQAFQDGWRVDEIFDADEDRPLVPAPPPADRRMKLRPDERRHRAKKRSAPLEFVRGQKDSASPTASSRIAPRRSPRKPSAPKRKAAGIVPTYRLVDTCAAEFEAYTPYYYSTYGDEDEAAATAANAEGHDPRRRPEPHRPGHRVRLLLRPRRLRPAELGFETIMVNSNPETVSTDYDTSDKLYFEPLTLEDVLNIYEREKPEGVIVQFGGQTPLNLADGLQKNGVRIIGTSPKSIELAEDRKLFAAMLDKLGLRQPPNGTATTEEEALASRHAASATPSSCAPVFVLGGRAMQIVYMTTELRRYMRERRRSHRPTGRCWSTGSSKTPPRWMSIASATARPRVIGAHHGAHRRGRHPLRRQRLRHAAAFSLSAKVMRRRSAHATKAMARELNVRGLMNVQFAVKGRRRLRPRSQPARLAHRAVRQQGHRRPAGQTRRQSHGRQDLERTRLHRGRSCPKHYSVKEAVFPFSSFPGVDISLGPEMKSTGEVMGIDADLGIAYAKSQMAARPPLPTTGNVFISVKDTDKDAHHRRRARVHGSSVSPLRDQRHRRRAEPAESRSSKVFKLREGRPNVLDMIKNGDITFIINTPSGKIPREDEVLIRTAALAKKIPIMTTVRAAQASANGIRSLQKNKLHVRSLQEYHQLKAETSNTERRTSNAE